ncbi:MAG TPA: hypothetical protein VN253_16065 [Kofleriaceae bacterium]|nr:hypothetical protein [Kofleriaceae bacterium]
MTRLTLMTILVASFGAACTNDLQPTEPTDNTPPPGSTTGAEDQTFDHENSFNPWELIDRLATEGPARYTSHVHGCPKVRYRTFKNVLTSLGVNANSTAALSPGKLYADGANAMGAPTFVNRIRENITTTTSGASRAFDIFAAAAQEVINAMPTLARCQVNGQPAVLFDGNTCRADGITCLIGTPAQPAHVDYCNLTVANATTPDIGKRVAVAALLAAAYTCE